MIIANTRTILESDDHMILFKDADMIGSAVAIALLLSTSTSKSVPCGMGIDEKAKRNRDLVENQDETGDNAVFREKSLAGKRKRRLSGTV